MTNASPIVMCGEQRPSLLTSVPVSVKCHLMPYATFTETRQKLDSWSYSSSDVIVDLPRRFIIVLHVATVFKAFEFYMIGPAYMGQGVKLPGLGVTFE
jgi:hypothetical protein